MNEEISATTYTVTVSSSKAGSRLDKFLADELTDMSRSRLRQLIDEGAVSLLDSGEEQEAKDASRKVKEGQNYLVLVPPPVAAEPVAQDIPLDIVHEDEDVIVIDKPAGMVVHPAPGSPDGTLVNALLGHAARQKEGGLSGIGGVERPGIVHRLDKGTSGLMVVAKNDKAHRALSEQFADRTIERAYYAIVWGVPNPTQGEISGNIGRSSGNRKKMAVVTRGGKVALTRYKLIKAYGSVASLVECRLATGRTHQIRVHMASIGHPVLGDPLYGGGGKAQRRGMSDSLIATVEALHNQVLHAYLLGFKLDSRGDSYHFKSQKPKYFNELIEKLESG